MAEGMFGVAAGLYPTMNWGLDDLEKEWERFSCHCESVFGGILSTVTDDKVKINYLKTFVGDKGREIFLTFTWATEQVQHGTEANPDLKEEKKCFHCVMLKFKTYVDSKRNPIRAALLFDQRRQKPGESFREFVTDLKLLVRGIDIADQDKLVRNAIVCRSLDPRVREACLDKKGKLTLTMAVDIGEDKEASKDTMRIMDGEDKSVTAVHKIQKSQVQRSAKRPSKSRGKSHSSAPVPSQSSSSSSSDCWRCGLAPHRPGQSCPAKHVECRICKKMGHWAKKCRKRTVNMIVEDNEVYEAAGGAQYDSDDSYEEVRTLSIRKVEIHREDQSSDDWWETLAVGRGTLRCQLDTGARASVMSKKDLQSVDPDAEL